MCADRADLVVIGAGCIGGWTAYHAARRRAGRVIVLEQGQVGGGASSRAAGIVRAQGGSATSVALGMWSIAFYERQAEEIGTDSGFRRLGYLLVATSNEAAGLGRQRVAEQRALGLDVTWLDADETLRRHPGLASGVVTGASFAPGDGAIDPERNVRAYSLALARAGVEVRERTPCLEVCVAGRPAQPRVTGVRTPQGIITTNRVVLTGGPTLANVGALAGTRIPVAGARHQVGVTAPHGDLLGEDVPMVFDVDAGTYWREHEGGLLFGMSNPEEVRGEARQIDWPYLDRIRRRLDTFVPAAVGLGLRKVWAATIDYTPDHLPILGPALARDRTPIAGATVASAAGHGMMWGPAVGKVAADLALTGHSEVIDTTDLGLDRFDTDGRSSLPPDLIALPFPTTT